MFKRLLVIGIMLCLLVAPAFADTFVRTYTIGERTYVITVTYTDYNHNGKIDSFRELRSITNIQVTVS